MVSLSLELVSLSEPLEVLDLTRCSFVAVKHNCCSFLYHRHKPLNTSACTLYSVSITPFTSNEIPISSAAVCILSGACCAHSSIIFALSPYNPSGRHQIHLPSAYKQPKCRSGSRPGLVRVTTIRSRAAGLVEDSGRVTTQVGLIYSSVRLVTATRRLQPHQHFDWAYFEERP